MGELRNGARSVLNFLHKCCKLSHLPGFRAGITGILGTDNAPAFFNLWDPMCAFVELLVSSDNWYNQIDYVPESDGDEDRSAEV